MAVMGGRDAGLVQGKDRGPEDGRAHFSHKWPVVKTEIGCR